MNKRDSQDLQSGIIFLALTVVLALLFVSAVVYRTYQARQEAVGERTTSPETEVIKDFPVGY